MGLIDDLARAVDRLLFEDSASRTRFRDTSSHRVITLNGYNFTEHVRKVLATARSEAARLHHEHVGTEHILLGILRDEDGVAASVLASLSIDRAAMRLTIEQMAEPGRSSSTGPDLPYTTRAKKVLELAMNEARDLNHSYVGTEHLLLGLLREETGIAARVLRNLGATTENVRSETLRLLALQKPVSHSAAVGGQPGEGVFSSHSAAENAATRRTEVEIETSKLERSWIQVHNALDLAERTSLTVRVERRPDDSVWLVLGDGIMFVRVPEIDRYTAENQADE